MQVDIVVSLLKNSYLDKDLQSFIWLKNSYQHVKGSCHVYVQKDCAVGNFKHGKFLLHLVISYSILPIRKSSACNKLVQA